MIKLPNSKFYSVEISSINILVNMTDTYNQLKQELSVLYPDVTDIELNEMTKRLIKFFAMGAKIAFEAKNTPKGTENNQSIEKRKN